MQALVSSAEPPAVSALPENGVGRTMVPTDEIIPNPDQPREYFDPEAMENLVKNILKFGHEKPIKVMILPTPQGKVKYMIFDGEFRWRASAKAGKEVWVIFEPFISDPEELFERSLNANYPQTPLTPMETIKAILRLENKGRTDEEIGLVFAKSAGWVQTQKKLSSLHPRVLGMTGPEIPEEKRLATGHAALLADLPHNQQLGLAEMAVTTGMTQSHLKNLVRATKADRRVPMGHSSSRPGQVRNEMRGLTGHFTRLVEDTAVFISHPGEFERIVTGREAAQIEKLAHALEKSRGTADKLLAALQKHRVAQT